MTRQFALDQGGVKRLKVTYLWNLSNARVFFDGQELAYFAEPVAFEPGAMFQLRDGSTLMIRYGAIEGAPFLKGVHLLHNGVPVPGSAAIPLPKWALAFMVAGAAIPVVSLGGALPAAFAIAGVRGVLYAARSSRWSAGI